MDPAVVSAFAVYLALMLGIGVAAWRRTADLSDYILGGRSLGRWVAALSAGASDMSGWLLLGLPGAAYLGGLDAVWIALGLLVGTWLNWRVVAARLRRFTHAAGDALTLPDYLENRFDDRSRTLRIVAAALILLFFLIYTSSGLVAGGKLFEEVFGLPYHLAVAAGIGTIIVYTFLGGFLAVSWTDLVQGLLMALALIVVPAAAVAAAGGPENTAAAIARINPALLDPFNDRDGGPLGVLSIVSLLGWGLGYFGQPHILARFMAIRDPAEVPAARRIAVTWVAIGLTGAIGSGLAGLALLEAPLADPEKVFMVLIAQLLHPVPAGICLAAILAAIMSTADSQLLVSSSALTEDFYKGLLRPHASQRELVWVGRLAVMTIAAIAGSVAMDPDSRVLDLVAYAWAGFGAAFGPVIVLSLLWPRMTRGGALAGMLVGGATVIVWKQLEGGLFDLYEIVPGVVLSTLAAVVLSRLGPPPGPEVKALIERMHGGATR